MAALFGFHMPNYTFPGVPADRLFDQVIHQAKEAEKAGFDLVTVMDHLYQIRGIGPETEPMLEAYTTLAALATQTSRVKLGTLVTGVTYRNPALLVKEVTTLDVISKGRAIFGIGAAWNEDEHVGYGFEFPPIGRRMDRLDEALTIAKLMFTQERPSFEGKLPSGRGRVRLEHRAGLRGLFHEVRVMNKFRVVVNGIATDSPLVGFADEFNVSRPGLAVDRAFTGYIAARRRRGLPGLAKGEVVKIIAERIS